MSELISLDQFRRDLLAGKRPDAAVWRLADPIGAIDGRTVPFCLSDASIDRMGDTIAVEGWQCADYLRNPIVLWAHDAMAPPIGNMARVEAAAGKLTGLVEFMPADLYPFADLIFRMVEGRWLRAGSVGFRPLDFAWSSEKGREFGIDFKQQELLEFSVVPVPANPNALVEARAAGLDTRPLALWAERLLDLDGKTVMMSRSELDRLRRLAQEPVSRQRAAGEWDCGAARDLPLDDSEAWDGPAAAASIFAYAGEGDFDPAKARRGFLLYNAAEPKLKGSYKDPFARAQGGELHAVKGGIKACASRLPQSDASAEAKAQAEAVIKHYEEKFGMVDPANAKSAGDAIAGNDPASGGVPGNCGRAAGEECGMKDPMECAVHGPLQDAMRALGEVVRRELAPLRELLLRAGVPNIEQEAMPLAKALNHLNAAHEAAKDLIEIDPDGDELGHKMACMAVHAHVKAADQYLEKHRDLQPPPDGDDEERAARLAALARD